jgi:hypothetical protein
MNAFLGTISWARAGLCGQRVVAVLGSAKLNGFSAERLNTEFAVGAKFGNRSVVHAGHAGNPGFGGQESKNALSNCCHGADPFV